MFASYCPRTSHRLESWVPTAMIVTGIGLYTFIPLLIGYLGKQGYIPNMSSEVCSALMDGRLKRTIIVAVLLGLNFTASRSESVQNFFDRNNPLTQFQHIDN